MTVISRLRQRLGDDARLRSIFRGGASGIAGKGMAMLVNAITLPLTVRYLGPLEYGIWVTISTTVAMLAMLDLGIASTLTNFISKAYAHQDDMMARRYFATALWVTAGICVVLGILGALAWRWIDWGTLFHLRDAHQAAETGTCAAICFGFFLLTLPLGLANKVLSGYQQVHLANYFAVLSSILGLVAIVSVVWMQGTLVQLMLFYCSAMLLGAIVLNLWLWLWHKPAVRPSFRFVHRPMVGELFGEGVLFFVLQLAGLIVFNSDNVVIAHYLGASEVTPYSVAWRLAGYAAMFQTMFMPAVWPALSEAYHRGDLSWIRSRYGYISRASLLAVGAAAVALGLGGRWLIRLWAGAAAVPSSPLLWCMSLWVVLLAVTVNQATLLAATRRLQLQAVCGSIAAIVNLALSIVLVQRIGVLGVLLATITSYVLFIVAPQEWEVRRVLRGRYVKAATADA